MSPRRHRLAVRTSVGVLVAVVGSVAVIMLLVQWAFAVQREDSTVFPGLYAAGHLLVERVEGADPDDLPELPPQVTVLPIHREPTTEEIAGRTLWEDDEVWVLAQAADGSWLQIGPLVRPPRFGPLPFFLILGALVVIVGGTGAGLSVPLLRRLRDLEEAAVRISDGDLSARATPSGNDAVTSLAERFNAMADQVSRLLDGQRALVRAVAHEIRTPVARVRFGAEMLAMATTDADRERRATELTADLDELDALVSELLIFSRLDAGAEVQLQEVPLRPAVERLVARLQRDVGVDVDPELAVHADPRSLARVVRNLLLNACRHAREHVSVRAWVEEDRVVVAVDDDGSGVPEADRERILEPFVRLDESRARDSGGAGLGLAIVRRAVELHGGTVRVEISPEGGARLATTWERA